MNPFAFNTYEHDGYPDRYEDLLAQDSRGLPQLLRPHGTLDVVPSTGMWRKCGWMLSKSISQLIYLN